MRVFCHFRSWALERCLPVVCVMRVFCHFCSRPVVYGWRRSISASFLEGLLRHPVLLTPKTVGTALVVVFAVILPVEATIPLVDAPPDIGSELGVCNA